MNLGKLELDRQIDSHIMAVDVCVMREYAYM